MSPRGRPPIQNGGMRQGKGKLLCYDNNTSLASSSFRSILPIIKTGLLTYASPKEQCTILITSFHNKKRKLSKQLTCCIVTSMNENI